jgi:molybdate-binding protein
MEWNQRLWRPTGLLVKNITKAGHMTSVIHLQTAMMRLLNREVGSKTRCHSSHTTKNVDTDNNKIQKKDQMPLSVHSLAVFLV